MSKVVPPFTVERRAAVNTRELRGGEVPQPGAKTPEALAQHIEAMICSFWDWPGNDYSNAELVYAIALGALRRMQEISGSFQRELDLAKAQWTSYEESLETALRSARETWGKIAADRDELLDAILNLSHWEAMRIAKQIKERS